MLFFVALIRVNFSVPESIPLKLWSKGVSLNPIYAKYAGKLAIIAVCVLSKNMYVLYSNYI